MKGDNCGIVFTWKTPFALCRRSQEYPSRAHPIIIYEHGRKEGIARGLICMSNPIRGTRRDIPARITLAAVIFINLKYIRRVIFDIHRSHGVTGASIIHPLAMKFCQSLAEHTISRTRSRFPSLSLSLAFELLRFSNKHTRARSGDRSLIGPDVIKMLHL